MEETRRSSVMDVDPASQSEPVVGGPQMNPSTPISTSREVDHESLLLPSVSDLETSADMINTCTTSSPSDRFSAGDLADASCVLQEEM
ncbi:unnamed protein product, partial [Amoebophrya sp. A120]|eukprot:GSA120T00025776001.1